MSLGMKHLMKSVNLTSFCVVLQHQLVTMLVFDDHYNGLPVGWGVVESGKAEEIARLLRALRDKAREVQPDWCPTGVLVDDSDAEIKAIRYQDQGNQDLTFV